MAKVMSLLIWAESTLGGEMKIWYVKSMYMLKVVSSERIQVLKGTHCKCVEDVNTLSLHNLLVHSHNNVVTTLGRGHRMVYNNHALCTLKLIL